MTDETNGRSNEHPGDNVTEGSATGGSNQFGNEYSDLVCAAFQARMSERIEAGEDLMDDPHMQTCGRCRALMGDLESIVEAVKLLMATEVEPPETMWQKIESAIKNEESPSVPGDLAGGLALEPGTA